WRSVQHRGFLPQPALLRRLVERVGYGFRPEEYALALQLGASAYVEHHLDPQAIDDSELDARLAPLVSLSLSAQQLVDQYIGTGNDVLPVHQLKHACVLRAVYSKRQLFEKVVEFWSDHFAVKQTKGTVRYLKVVDDRDVIRAHAFGRFRDLLAASAHSAAMLRFLDNDTNTLAGPNENYARELLELHTLGVTGGYTEQDVKEAARCLTGWHFVPWGGSPYGEFSFVPGLHDQGAKLVLGHVFPAGGGQSDGETLIELLADHPSTPRHVGRKLARWLLRYEPSAALVDAVAARWQATDGDLREVVREILSPPWLAEAQLGEHPKLRRPFHYAMGLLASLRAEIAHPAAWTTQAPLVAELERLGQRPFEWFDPDGYPDNEGAWASGLQPRWSFASRLLAGQIAGVQLDGPALTAQIAALGAPSPGWAVDLLLTGGAFSDLDRGVLDGYAAGSPPSTWPQLAELIALGACARSYQYY
ncbi:MAG TPA: DUF1800 domain-containing protein, partial [Planctomycetota bacterium]|nr:DUF1800 domain-containing protein [Planctomycetota bacterium]